MRHNRWPENVSNFLGKWLDSYLYIRTPPRPTSTQKHRIGMERSQALAAVSHLVLWFMMRRLRSPCRISSPVMTIFIPRNSSSSAWQENRCFIVTVFDWSCGQQFHTERVSFRLRPLSCVLNVPEVGVRSASLRQRNLTVHVRQQANQTNEVIPRWIE